MLLTVEALTVLNAYNCNMRYMRLPLRLNLFEVVIRLCTFGNDF